MRERFDASQPPCEQEFCKLHRIHQIFPPSRRLPLEWYRNDDTPFGNHKRKDFYRGFSITPGRHIEIEKRLRALLKNKDLHLLMFGAYETKIATAKVYCTAKKEFPELVAE
ncbi:hypothetical protein H2201_002203 [Coniosporium apollinis]|uniref:Uncharacterized protein n=1 Tax=Coniosporium apollinis TaxID=61459 RepID=A0ABQ9P0W4_9PEZI|nr:hypothetical protein H2201_002203 [Coniosporium apollinis]